MLPAAHRVRRSDEFRDTLKRGRRCGGRLVVTHLARSKETGPAKVGFIVSRAVGNAVLRNLVKRRLRNLMHDRLGLLPEGAVVVVRALPASAQASYADLGDALDLALHRLGLVAAA